MIDFADIDTVLLDMDGTLLDLRFDNVFWNELLPAHYAEQHGQSALEARARITSHIARVRQHLDFYCVDAWSRFVGFDVGAQLHAKLAHLIAYRPHAQSFVAQMIAMNKDVRLVTNAHRASIDVKHRVTGIVGDLPYVYSSHDFGHAKETDAFWQTLHTLHPFTAARTLLIDDNETVLDAGARFGIAHTIAITAPDSGKAAKHSERHRGVAHFVELLPQLASASTPMNHS